MVQLETVCRAVSIPETPESARLRVFIVRKDGTQLTCSHYWAPNPVRELVNRLHFEINSKIAEDVAVVQAVIDERITRTKVKPLPAYMKKVTGEVSDELTFVLAAPIHRADGSIRALWTSTLARIKVKTCYSRMWRTPRCFNSHSTYKCSFR